MKHICSYVYSFGNFLLYVLLSFAWRLETHSYLARRSTPFPVTHLTVFYCTLESCLVVNLTYNYITSEADANNGTNVVTMKRNCG